MTSYWKPRWPNRVLFGSHCELRYRIDIETGSRSRFCLSTDSGPGFEIELARSRAGGPGFATSGKESPPARAYWLDVASCREAISKLLDLHFSKIIVTAKSIQCYCDPQNNDVLPEASQLTWCLSLIHELWSAVPESERRAMTRAEFIV
jgi:hypothetical protein